MFYIKYFIVLIDFDIFKFELQNQRLFKIRQNLYIKYENKLSINLNKIYKVFI